MSLSANAKPFVFKVSAKSFVPGGAAPAAAAPVAAAPAPTPVAAVTAQVAAVSVSAPAPVAAATPAAEPVKENWDDEDTAPAAAAAATPAPTPVAVTPTPTPTPPAPTATKTPEPVTSSKKKKKVEYKVHDTREHLNIVLIGHVDAGKSTISGQLMLLTNQVDERTIAKYEKEAKEKNRDSWYLAYIMDTSEEERNKGKTVEVGRAHFETPKKRYTLLDAPGHKNYVPNMIGGAAQADVGVLVISARRGEFETGFDRGGQTREHAMLAKTLGLQKLIILVNKMDEKTVKWAKARFDEVEKKLSPFLRKWGYKAKDITYVPCSGYTGANLVETVDPKVCDWYKGESFMSTLDNLPAMSRDTDGAVRMPIMARYKDRGALCCLGKLESGSISEGDKLILQPSMREVVCSGLIVDDQEVKKATCGENLVVKIKGAEEEHINAGFVLSDVAHPTRTALKFKAQIVVLALMDHKPLLTAGYQAVLHCHTIVQECLVRTLVSEFCKKTKTKKPRPRYLKKDGVGEVIITVDESVAVEAFKDFGQLGRFTLRDEGKTIAIGKILSIAEIKK